MNAVTQIETRAIETARAGSGRPDQEPDFGSVSQLRRAAPSATHARPRACPGIREHRPHRSAAKPRRHPVRRWRAIRSGGGRPPPDREAWRRRSASPPTLKCLAGPTLRPVPSASRKTCCASRCTPPTSSRRSPRWSRKAAPSKHCRRLRRDPLVVQRRLKLANVSPRLLADYRGGAVTLEQLMALTITDDHAAQEAAFYGAPEWAWRVRVARTPDRARNRRHASASALRWAGRLHGGGRRIRRDLFAEGDAGTYLTDAALLETLVRSKLDALAGNVRAEGWAWVEAVPHMSYAERQAFQNAPRQRREPSAREARRIASLQTRLDKIDAELEEAYDAEDEDKTEALEPRREQVAGELQAVEEALRATPGRARRGRCHRHPDRGGEAVIHRGLLREAANALRTLERLRQGFGSAEGEAGNDDEGEDAEQPGREPVRPAGAAVERAPHRRAANRSRPTSASRAGRAGAWHGAERLAGQPLRPRLAAGREPESARPAGRHGPDWPESPAAVALRELQQVAGEALPQDSRTVRRAAGDGARRTGAAAGGMRGGDRGRGDASRHGATAGRGTGAGRGLTWPHGGSPPQTGISSMCRRPRFWKPWASSQRTRHTVGKVEEGLHCQRSGTAGRWYGLDARRVQERTRHGAAGRRGGRGRCCRRSGSPRARRLT